MMLARLQARQPGAPLGRVFWWYGLHGFCYAWVGSLYHYRAWGIENIPRTGPVLLISNHQSYLDPVLVGLGAHRRQFYAMARSTLFANPVFAWLIRSLNAIPIERGESDIAAMRKAIEILSRGHALLVFPEGTRTLDGRVGPFQNGIMLLIKRTRPTIVPVAIQGAFDAWPKGRAAPKLTGKIGTMFGQPIAAQDLIKMGAKQGLASLRHAIEAMRIELSRRLESAPSSPTPENGLIKQAL